MWTCFEDYWSQTVAGWEFRLLALEFPVALVKNTNPGTSTQTSWMRMCPCGTWESAFSIRSPGALRPHQFWELWVLLNSRYSTWAWDLTDMSKVAQGPPLNWDAVSTWKNQIGSFHVSYIIGALNCIIRHEFLRIWRFFRWFICNSKYLLLHFSLFFSSPSLEI